jgi:tellurite resistance protein
MTTQNTLEQACTNNVQETLQNINAAKFYLRSQGQAGTMKQIEKLTSQFAAEAILRMARDRGYSA